MSRSREGAWIEMPKFKHSGKTERVAPARDRGLKYIRRRPSGRAKTVAPARERGLKYADPESRDKHMRSLPRGSVD